MLYHPFKRMVATCRGTGGSMSGWTFVDCGYQCSMTHSSTCTFLPSEGVITVKFHLLKVDYELSPKGLPGCTFKSRRLGQPELPLWVGSYRGLGSPVVG